MTHVVSGLFGAMIALVVYTRLGGLATVLLAGAVLVGYILVEMYRGWRELLATQLVHDPEHHDQHDQHEDEVVG